AFHEQPQQFALNHRQVFHDLAHLLERHFRRGQAGHAAAITEHQLAECHQEFALVAEAEGGEPGVVSAASPLEYSNDMLVELRLQYRKKLPQQDASDGGVVADKLVPAEALAPGALLSHGEDGADSHSCIAV